MDYQEFVKFVNNHSAYTDKHVIGHRRLCDLASGYVDSTRINAYYLRNLFVEGDKELFLFERNNIWNFSISSDNIAKVKCINNYHLENVELEWKNNDIYYGVQLRIKLNNEVIIELDSSKDTNENWIGEYSELIKKIFNFLTKTQ